MRRQSFQRGAAFIAAASILGKILSAVFRIPLDRYILHEDGMGVFNTAYSVYNMLLVVVCAGFPIAQSKLIAEKEGDEDAIGSVAVTARRMISGVSLLCFFAMFLGAPLLAAAFKMPQAEMPIRAMSFAFLFLGMVSAYRGYFQGRSDMLPTAASQVAESAAKLCAGLLIGFAVINSVNKVGFVSLSVALGAAASCGVLMLFAKGKIRGGAYSKDAGSALFAAALPITVTSAVYALVNFIDTATVNSLGVFDSPESILGYLGRAMTLYNLPVSVINALVISIAPAVAGALAKDDAASAQNSARSAMRLSLFVSVPCAAGFIALAQPILSLLYNDGAYSELLAIIAVAVIFAPMTQLGAVILQAAGKFWTPVINMAIGCAVKVILNVALLGRVGAAASVASTAVIYVLVSLLNIFAIQKSFSISFSPLDMLVRPFVCGAAVYAVAALIHSHMGGIIGTAAAIGAAAAVYLVLAPLVKLVTKDDILSIVKKEAAQ